MINISIAKVPELFSFFARNLEIPFDLCKKYCLIHGRFILGKAQEKLMEMVEESPLRMGFLGCVSNILF